MLSFMARLKVQNFFLLIYLAKIVNTTLKVALNVLDKFSYNLKKGYKNDKRNS